MPGPLTVDDVSDGVGAWSEDAPPLRLWADDRPLPAWAREIAKDFDVEELLETIIPRCLTIAFPNQAHDDEFREHLVASCSEPTQSAPSGVEIPTRFTV